MYKQTVEPKKFTRGKTALLAAIAVSAVAAVFLLIYLTNSGFPPLAAACIALLIVLAAGVWLYRKQHTSYTYTFREDTLIVEQFSGKRLVKELRVAKADVTAVTEGAAGQRLFPKSAQPVTVQTAENKYALALDEKLIAYLRTPSVTDAFIDQNTEAMLNDLKELIAIPSVKENEEDNLPFGEPCAQALEYVLTLCESFGMETANIDNYCGWAQIGEGDTLLGILCHLDVVPAGDGWEGDPFTARVTDREIFGRGSIDDKGPAIAAIYAVAAVKEAMEELPCRVRLIFGCDEESGWACMDRYKQTEDIPDIAFTPDADYPVIITEKGIAHINLRTSLAESNYQLYIRGGLRPNMVPDKATATVIGNMDKLQSVLAHYDAKAFGLEFTVEDDHLDIVSTGVGAHGSTPEKGKNALFELFRLLKALHLGGSQGDFVDAVMDMFVDKTDGSGVHLHLQDEASGSLSLNLGICLVGRNDLDETMQDDSCRLVLDIRYPITYGADDILARLQTALPGSWSAEILHAQAPHHVDPASPLVRTLMDVYRDYTGRDDEPLAIGGGTYARALPGKAVAFGVQFPDREDKAHQPNESLVLEDFYISAKMFAAAIVRLLEQA